MTPSRGCGAWSRSAVRPPCRPGAAHRGVASRRWPAPGRPGEATPGRAAARAPPNPARRARAPGSTWTARVGRVCGARPDAPAPLRSEGGRRMAIGTVKWFNAQKGFGFIQPEGGGRDVLVHVTAVQAAGLRGLDEGQKVSFEVVTGRGKPAADNLR